jgi:hypothetical protein
MIIRREAIQAALAATTNEKTRYHLDGIQAEPAANRVVGTDGHVLLIATDNSPFPDADFPSVQGATFHGDPALPVLIPSDVCKAMIGTMPKRSPFPILACAQLGRNGSDTSATLVATDLQAPRIATLNNPESRFPTYQRILDTHKDRPDVEVILGVEVLETLIKAAKALTKAPGGVAKWPSIRLMVPIGRKDRQPNPIKDPETGEIRDGAPGAVISGINVAIVGRDVTVTGVVMPMRA